LTDDDKTVRSKINKYAFSGGRDTVEQHRKHGGNPDVDSAYQLLYFFHQDDAYVDQIAADYRSGKLLSGELKKLAADCITALLAEHQARRAKAQLLVDEFVFTG
jgi:tryptophanyl-tRNA synthetase